MKLTNFLMTLCVAFPITGCALWTQQEIPVEEEALFCDVEEPRKFSQEELDWRSANAPWNLRRDFKTNTTWDRECDPLTEGKTDGL